MVNLGKRMRLMKRKVSRYTQTSAPACAPAQGTDYFHEQTSPPPQLRKIDSNPSPFHFPQLLTIRCGPGAAILPQYLPKPDPNASSGSGSGSSSSATSLPQPTLLRIRLDFPPGLGPASVGARAFWRNHLRRLKYYNPALPIVVNSMAENGKDGSPGPAWRLFLDFEGEEAALRGLVQETTVKKKGGRENVEDRGWKGLGSSTTEKVESSQSQSLSQSTQSGTLSSLSSPQSPSLSSSPLDAQSTPLSTRTVSLPLINRTAGALWFWFQKRTNCVDVVESPSDAQLAAELSENDEHAAEDRARVKKGIDEIKAKEEMLKIARREVDRMTVEG